MKALACGAAMVIGLTACSYARQAGEGDEPGEAGGSAASMSQANEGRGVLKAAVAAGEGFALNGSAPVQDGWVSLPATFWPVAASKVAQIVRAACDREAVNLKIRQNGQGFEGYWGESYVQMPDQTTRKAPAYVAQIKPDDQRAVVKVYCGLINY